MHGRCVGLGKLAEEVFLPLLLPFSQQAVDEPSVFLCELRPLRETVTICGTAVELEEFGVVLDGGGLLLGRYIAPVVAMFEAEDLFLLVELAGLQRQHQRVQPRLLEEVRQWGLEGLRKIHVLYMQLQQIYLLHRNLEEKEETRGSGRGQALHRDKREWREIGKIQ